MSEQSEQCTGQCTVVVEGTSPKTFWEALRPLARDFDSGMEANSKLVPDPNLTVENLEAVVLHKLPHLHRPAFPTSIPPQSFLKAETKGQLSNECVLFVLRHIVYTDWASMGPQQQEELVTLAGHLLQVVSPG